MGLTKRVIVWMVAFDAMECDILSANGEGDVGVLVMVERCNGTEERDC